MVVGVVSPGAMGSAVGAAYAEAGHRVVVTVTGRSARTRELAATAHLEELPDLDAVVGSAQLVLSIVPPGEALATAEALAAAAARTDAAPLVADLNAVAPHTALRIDAVLAGVGVDLVDGSISGGPPRADYRTRIYLSGPRADEVAAGVPPWLDARIVGDGVGAASAVKMCTASVYKGQTAILAHALLTAEAHGVLPEVLDDLGDSFPRQVDRAARTLAVSATKADRFVGEMREIAAAQGEVGLTPALFDAMASVWEALAATPLAGEAPEAVPTDPDLGEVLARLSPLRSGRPEDGPPPGR